MIRKFGLIGYPLSHSFSPGYFADKFKNLDIQDAEYGLYPLADIKAFEGLKKSKIQGINVTIPYKEQIIPYLDELSPAAKAIGAVNVIDLRNDRLVGYNSDAYGFQYSLEPIWKGRSIPSHALVLGTGGAAKAVWYVLESLGIQYKKVSRSKGDLTYEELDKKIMTSHQLIINTTPLGMSPEIYSCPNIPYENISSNHMCFDLVYNPSKTLFLTKSEKQGASIENGLRMLELQAERSWEIWNS
ncbi:MAG: shikimate dehydrogenase [Saprospiraceae bacterium]|jgi:shikimate dehydrogenase